MNTVFTYGSRKTGVSPKTILFGAYDMNHEYQAYAVFGRIPFMPAAAADLLLAKDLPSIKAALARSVKYEADVRAFYDHMLSTTNSPGKSDRIRNDRRDVTGPTIDAIGILRSGIATIEADKASAAIASQSDFNSNTGRATTPEEKASNPQSTGASPISKLILPIGAALAALFFLKGH